MPLFEMTVKATKTFFIEADSEEDALGHPAAQDEFTSGLGDVEFDCHEMGAQQCDEFGERYAREREPELILS